MVERIGAGGAAGLEEAGGEATLPAGWEAATAGAELGAAAGVQVEAASAVVGGGGPGRRHQSSFQRHWRQRRQRQH